MSTEHKNSQKGQKGNDKNLGNQDVQGEGPRRYENLEPEGYSRHSHGNREGEIQGEKKSSLPLEQSAPMPDVRYRKDVEKVESENQTGYGGGTQDSKAQKHDSL